MFDTRTGGLWIILLVAILLTACAPDWANHEVKLWDGSGEQKLVDSWYCSSVERPSENEAICYQQHNGGSSQVSIEAGPYQRIEVKPLNE